MLLTNYKRIKRIIEIGTSRCSECYCYVSIGRAENANIKKASLYIKTRVQGSVDVPLIHLVCELGRHYNTASRDERSDIIRGATLYGILCKKES